MPGIMNVSLSLASGDMAEMLLNARFLGRLGSWSRQSAPARNRYLHSSGQLAAKWPKSPKESSASSCGTCEIGELGGSKRERSLQPAFGGGYPGSSDSGQQQPRRYRRAAASAGYPGSSNPGGLPWPQQPRRQPGYPGSYQGHLLPWAAAILAAATQAPATLRRRLRSRSRITSTGLPAGRTRRLPGRDQAAVPEPAELPGPRLALRVLVVRAPRSSSSTSSSTFILPGRRSVLPPRARHRDPPVAGRPAAARHRPVGLVAADRR